VHAAESAHAGLVAQCLAERGANRQRGVFNRVVGVDVKVAVRPYREIESAVAPSWASIWS
jgi:hypothetical protein